MLLQAAAAMCVGMGSFSDPFEAQGLAHFLGELVALLYLLSFSVFISSKNFINC